MAMVMFQLGGLACQLLAHQELERHMKCEILVVDDDPCLCRAVEAVLRLLGHSVVTAQNGLEALDVFAPNKFHLVFTDYLMPALTGDKLAAAIKSLSPNQPILMLTAFAENFWPASPLLSCVDGLISKPFQIDIIRQAVLKFSRAT
jgi:CheY-like chemotaxis protein